MLPKNLQPWTFKVNEMWFIFFKEMKKSQIWHDFPVISSYQFAKTSYLDAEQQINS